jgi:hypothetical protein
MKKTFTLAALLGVVLHACGQGQFGFNNTSLTLISTNAIHGGPALGPTDPYPGSGEPQFVYGIFAAPSTVSSVSGVTDPNWTFTGSYATNRAFAGRLLGGVVTLPSPYAAGTTYNFLIRGWSSNIAGQDWTGVQAFIHNLEIDPLAYGSQGQFFGTSSIATMIVSGPLNPTQVIFGTSPGYNIQGFLLDQVPTPEPSSFALVALGGVAWTVSRRVTKHSDRIDCGC